jgi:hypothetical protein
MLRGLYVRLQVGLGLSLGLMQGKRVWLHHVEDRVCVCVCVCVCVDEVSLFSGSDLDEMICEKVGRYFLEDRDVESVE